jgi:hypothetical protein
MINKMLDSFHACLPFRDKEERKKIAFDILNLDDRFREIYSRIEHYECLQDRQGQSKADGGFWLHCTGSGHSLGLPEWLVHIFDYRMGVRKPAELQFLQKITTEIKPAKCHAKVTVVENDNWGISIVGSANYTRNPRIEAGVLFTCRNVAAFERN